MTKRFKLVANEFFNTGGNCMVDITTVYDRTDKKMLYVFSDNEWLVVSTYDYVREELPDGIGPSDCVLYQIESRDFSTEPTPDNRDMLDMPDEYFDLVNSGWLHYIKNKFDHYKQLTYTTADNLPVELGRTLDVDYVAWCDDRNQLIATDGYKIVYDDSYACQMYDSNGKAAVEFDQLLDKLREDADIDSDHLDKFYNSEIHLVIDNKVFTLGMTAAVWNGLKEYAEYIISEQ